LSLPINAVTTREKNSGNVVQGNTDAKKDGPDNGGDTKTAVSATGDMDEVVYVLKVDGTVKKVKVRTDIQDINYIEIVDGVKDGDEVITGPYSIVSKTLKEGMRVKVVPKDQLFEAKKD
jgi:HlyD family secretion protein